MGEGRDYRGQVRYQLQKMAPEQESELRQMIGSRLNMRERIAAGDTKLELYLSRLGIEFKLIKPEKMSVRARQPLGIGTKSRR